MNMNIVYIIIINVIDTNLLYLVLIQCNLHTNDNGGTE